MEKKINHKTAKGGRKVLEEQEKRTHQVKVMFNDGEFEEIRKKAFLASMSNAEYLRNQILGKEIKEALSAENARILREWARVSNNLNQLVKVIHKEGVLAYASKIEKMIQYVNDKIYPNE